ncbi:MAG TPA: putative monovalent cation/H+ antiporter subunit A, partial [Anaerolineales bacterium]|nr:putative monovalent cation/H+ antiporter subunit A [Anaerolineales bacterium]
TSFLFQNTPFEPFRVSFPWVPSLGLTLSFNVDGLGLLFALLITGIGVLVVVYAGGYMKHDPHLNRFYAWLLAFMAAMLGVVLADNLILVYVFWEITSLTSFMLIGFHHEDEEGRKAALQALLVTVLGGLAMLAGFLLLGISAGTFEVSALRGQADSIQASNLYIPILVLILLGAFTKSAQFPFHFWLPNAMQAPTPVSAYLHSATMVKAGVYLLFRLTPVLGGGDVWFYSVAGVGALTMVVGGYLALSQTDLKRLLAYSTISALGMLTLLIGLGSSKAIEAALVLLVAHALYKGALFLVAGAVDHESGTRDVTRLGGLARLMPLTTAAAGLAALSMAGILPTLGFISKELLYEVTLERGAAWFAPAFAAAIFTVFVAAVAGLSPFWSQPVSTSKQAHEAPASMWLGPLALAGLGVLFGLIPQMVSKPLITPAANAILPQSTSVELDLWHGVSPVFLLSLLTLGVGAMLYWARGMVRKVIAGLEWPWGPEKWYAWSLDAIEALAGWQTRLLQNGYLRYYLMTIVLATVGLAGTTLIFQGGLHWPSGTIVVRFYEAALGILILMASFAAVRSRSRLGAVAALGITGYSVALIFLLFGAPDLAMTQFLIESLTVVFFVFAFYHLPHFAQLTPTPSRVAHAVIALLAGGLMTALVLSATGTNLYPKISQYFVDNALPLAHGRNIVNVILVDFRGMDTLGEISVLAVASVGVYALLKFRAEHK